jgi:hypothetical protein
MVQGKKPLLWGAEVCYVLLNRKSIAAGEEVVHRFNFGF